MPIYRIDYSVKADSVDDFIDVEDFVESFKKQVSFISDLHLCTCDDSFDSVFSFSLLDQKYSSYEFRKRSIIKHQ